MQRPLASLLLCAALLAASALPAPAGPRLIENEDGTLTDPQAGLMWSAQDNQGAVDWQDARRWARFTFPSTLPADAGGWRLPTIQELESLFEASAYYGGYESDCGLNVRISSAIRLSCGFVWSSEESGIQARYYNFKQGFAVLDRKAKARGHRALAVRLLNAEEMAELGKE